MNVVVAKKTGRLHNVEKETVKEKAMSLKVDSTDHFVNVLSLLPCTSKTGGKKLFIMTDTDETKCCHMMNGMNAANIQKAGEIIVSPKFLFPRKITITPRPLLLYLNTSGRRSN